MNEVEVMASSRVVGLLWSLMLPLIGCGNEAVGEGPDVTVADSAGVVVVEVGPLDHVAAPEWALDLAFSTARTGVELSRVAGGRILSDGRVLVADDGRDGVFILGADGRLRRQVGGPGQGPGEFRAPSFLHPTADGFSVYDARLGRWTRFDGAGSVVSTRSMAPPSGTVDLKPLAMSADGGILAVYGEIRGFSEEAVHRDTTPLLRYAAPGAAPDTIGWWPGDEWAYSTKTGAMRFKVGFGRSLAASGRGELAVLGDTDSLNLSLYNAEGAVVLRIRGGGAGMTATEEEGRRWQRETASRLPASTPEAVREVFLEAPYHQTYPAFDGAIVDSEGRVWVGTAARLGAGERRWVVFNREGSPVGRLEIPADAEILDATSHALLLRETDASDVHTVALYSIQTHD